MGRHSEALRGQEREQCTRGETRRERMRMNKLGRGCVV